MHVKTASVHFLNESLPLAADTFHLVLFPSTVDTVIPFLFRPNFANFGKFSLRPFFFFRFRLSSLFFFLLFFFETSVQAISPLSSALFFAPYVNFKGANLQSWPLVWEKKKKKATLHCRIVISVDMPDQKSFSVAFSAFDHILNFLIFCH